MSNEQMQASMRYWYGPFFPSSTEALHTLYAEGVEKYGQDTALLVRAANGMRNFRHPCTGATDDGYYWARGLVFKVLRPGNLTAGLALVMFPECKDGAKRGGTRTDRSIAVYTSSEAILLEELDKIVRELHPLLVNVHNYEVTLRANMPLAQST